jgi:hypothetical protein
MEVHKKGEMKMKKTLLTAVVAVGLMVAGTVTPASALFIDFTSTAWKGATGNKSYSVGSAPQVTLTAGGVSNPTLNFNTLNPAQSFILDSHTFAGAGDGIGVKTDFISGDETLKVAFNPTVTVDALYFLNINRNESVRVKWNNTGNWSADYFGTGTGTSVAQNILGALIVDLNPDKTNVSSILFQAGDGTFSLAGLDTVDAVIPGPGAPVPEPGTMMLLGMGMAGLAVYGKRRANKA